MCYVNMLFDDNNNNGDGTWYWHWIPLLLRTKFCGSYGYDLFNYQNFTSSTSSQLTSSNADSNPKSFRILV